MNRKHKTLTIAVILMLAVFGAYAASTMLTSSDDTDTSTSTTDTEIVTITTAEGGATSDQYGLQPYWQRAYNDSSSKTHGYKLNGSGIVTEQCGNCHMSDGSGNATKHEPPLHPIGLYDTDTGDWFYDDGNHRGPNTQLATGFSGIKPNLECGNCHTPDTASDFAVDGGSLTNDPHSVHRDVLKRIGCIRCHVYNNRTLTVSAAGNITIEQGNASRSSYGIANPINMTRLWDSKFLSTKKEANYTYNAGSGGLSSSGSGWNVYGTIDGDHGQSQYSCPDCHDQYHKNGGLGFTFNDTTSSRKGPWAEVNHSDSIGINSSGVKKTCGDCHVTDAHSVHTNGGLVTAVSWAEANSTTDTSSLDSNARGAEFCDECHSQNIVQQAEGFHGGTDAAQKLGLNGSKNVEPDLQANSSLTGLGSPVGTGNVDEDCGFCHKTKNEK